MWLFVGSYITQQSSKHKPKRLFTVLDDALLNIKMLLEFEFECEFQIGISIKYSEAIFYTKTIDKEHQIIIIQRLTATSVSLSVSHQWHFNSLICDSVQ